MSSTQIKIFTPGLRANFGVARRDITPPEGIDHRNWGAAEHDTSLGVHRPLSLTVLFIKGGENEMPLYLFSMDLGWWRNKKDFDTLQSALVEVLEVSSAQIILALTHTHAGPVLDSTRKDLPGGDKIKAYLKFLQKQSVEAAQEARKNCFSGILTYRKGHSGLAVNRDFPSPEDPDTFLVGWNPGGEPDTTLLLGEVRDAEERVRAVLVNYACHPTTLAWDNQKISPDYVGAMCGIVEQHMPGALAIFLQGASGELSPRDQYTGDIAVAEQHGRRLGYAVLEAMQDGGHANHGWTYSGGRASGARLAIWEKETQNAATTILADEVQVEFSLKKGRESRQQLSSAEKVCGDRVKVEQIRRKLGILDIVGEGHHCEMGVWIWRCGDGFIIAHPNEAYSLLQTELRKRFPQNPILVLNVSNGSGGYLPPANLYEKKSYAVWQTPFEKGSLEQLIEVVTQKIVDALAAPLPPPIQ